MDVAGGGEAESTGELGREVADNVAEEIVGDDDVELAGVADEFHGEGVYIKVAGIDVGEFGADGFEDALPEVVGESHGVGFVGHAEAEGRTARNGCATGGGCVAGADVVLGRLPAGATKRIGGDAGEDGFGGAGVGAGVVEGVADDAVYAFVGVDVFLDGDFVGSSLLEEAANADVEAFGVFAEDHEVEVGRGAIF